MEESGKIIITASDEVMKLIESGDVIGGITQCATFGGMESDVIKRSRDPTIDKAKHIGDYVMLSYDCAEWAAVSEAFVSKGTGIEYYARHSDEYGTESFYALTASGDKHGLQIDVDGDAMESDSYKEEATEALITWKKAIPASVKKSFPGFAEVEPDDYIY